MENYSAVEKVPAAKKQALAALPEEYVVFPPGFGNECFRPILAGHTNKNPAYRITRVLSDAYIFEHIISGEGTLLLDGHSIPLCAGDAFILPVGSTHTYYTSPDNPFEKLWLNVRGQLVEHLLADYHLPCSVVVKSFGNHDYMQNIWEYARMARSVDADGLAVLLHRFVAALANHQRFGSSQYANEVAWRVRGYIDGHFKENETVSDIACKIGYSKSRIDTIFRAEFKISPHKYLIYRKMETARMLLLNTASGIEEIAVEVGFSDSHYFSNCFRRTFGLPPGKYRACNGKFK